MEFQAYHGVNAATHQAHVTNLSKRGFGMISLSVYGEPGDAQYAAVWVNRPMPQWSAIHGVDGNGYQAWFNQNVKAGFGASLVSATGSGGDAIFAAVMTKGVGAGWVAHHGLTATQFKAVNDSAMTSGLRPHSVTIYGDSGSRLYAGVWWPNTDWVKWMVNQGDPASSYQHTFNLCTQLPGYTLNAWRPAYVALSNDHTYCSVYSDDVVDSWYARHGLTAAEYQTEFDNQKKAGRYPICVQGGGSGSDTRYAAVFAKNDVPEPRQWTATGQSVAAYQHVDQLFQAFMAKQAVRAAQVSILKNGATVFNRGYTWAEPGYRTTQPSDRFLLASCSKMFCEAAIQSLYDAKILSPGDAAFAKLGISNPSHVTDHDKITVQQLLDHTSGYDDGVAPYFDPTYSMGQIANSIGNPHPTRFDICKYMYSQPLQHAPGTTNAYSNFGYLMLAALVDNLGGTGDYWTYLKKTLLDPAGITEVEVISTAASGRHSDEAIAEDPGIGQNVLNPAVSDFVPSVYGGDGEINEVGVGNDGLGASAHALARFGHLHAVWGNGPRVNSGREGSTPGASTFVWTRDEFDIALTVNTRAWRPGTNPVTLPNGKKGSPVEQLQMQVDAAIS
jgi:CubicO group peptidase (beta-lactamase class C family)